jgi:twitching motility protein PilU
VPAVEVLLNSRLTAELIEQGDFSGVKEAMNNSLAEGSQTFEHDIARLITEGVVDRKEGIAFADSPTNLVWRLQNDFTTKSAPQQVEQQSDEASFTEITLDVFQPSTDAAAKALP